MAVTRSVNEQNRFSLEKLGALQAAEDAGVPKRMRGKWKTTTTKSIESPGSGSSREQSFIQGGTTNYTI